MKKKIVLLTLVSVSLLSAMVITSVVAQPRIVGVTEGNWFEYGDISVDWSSNDPNATFPPSGWEWLETLNKTERMLMSVKDVSGTNITFQAKEHFKNDTEKIRSGYIDIDTGDGSEETAETTDMTFMVISANLEENDTLYASGDYSTYKINETIIRTYPDVERETNHLNMIWEYSITNDIELNYYFSINFYWDKLTGILVENSFEQINQTGEYLTIWSAWTKITDSNVWIVPEFPTWTSILLVFVILTFSMIIYKRKLLKTPITKYSLIVS